MNKTNFSGLDEYIIKARSHLDDRKSYWFEGLTITTGYDENGWLITTFTGHLDDQAALYGVLVKIRDMTCPLFRSAGFHRIRQTIHRPGRQSLKL